MPIITLVILITILFIAFQVIAIPVGIFSSISVLKAESWAALAAIVTAIVIIAVLEFIRPKIDTSPTVVPEEIQGNWYSEERQLQLGDYTYTVKSDNNTYSGTWKINDWNLYLSKESEEDEYLHIIKYKDEKDYRLLIGSENKYPDTYDYSNAFIKQQAN